jgi:hypothetical protein
MKKLMQVITAFLLATVLMCAYMTAHAQTQCTATTKKGTQCSRKAHAGSAYCTQHDPHSVKCAALTKAGKPCQLQPRKGGQFCHIHSSK